MYAIATDFRWNPDESITRSRWLPGPCKIDMEKVPDHPGIKTEWTSRFSEVFMKLKVVFPGRINPSKKVVSDLAKFVEQALTYIHKMCTPDVREPRCIEIILYLWNENKRLPDTKGEPITPECINTGWCHQNGYRKFRIFIFRKEDVKKTIVHELVHSYGIGHWCDEDAVILQQCRQIATNFNIPPGTVMRPSEAIVDAYAVKITSNLLGIKDIEVVNQTRRVLGRICTHFDEDPWIETTNALCYIAIKLVLLQDVNLLMSMSMDDPDRGAIRNAFYADVPLVKKAKGKSLRMFPLIKTNNKGLLSAYTDRLFS